MKDTWKALTGRKSLLSGSVLWHGNLPELLPRQISLSNGFTYLGNLGQ